MKWHCKNFKWNKCWSTKEPKAVSPRFTFSAQKCIFEEARSLERGDSSFLKLHSFPHHRFYDSDNAYPQNLPAQVLFQNAEFIKGMEPINLLLCTIWWRTKVTSGQELEFQELHVWMNQWLTPSTHALEPSLATVLGNRRTENTTPAPTLELMPHSQFSQWGPSQPPWHSQW